MRKFGLSEQQFKNLVIFLDRVGDGTRPLRGLQEATALVELFQAINKPLLDMIKPNDDNQPAEQREAEDSASAEKK